MAELQWISVVLGALYARGGPRPFDVKRSQWPLIERCLRVRPDGLHDVLECLRSCGHWAEATLLDSPGLLSWSENSIASGFLLTAVDDSYPKRWLKVLGQSAPPAVWLAGELPATSGYISVVGSRSANRAALKFAEGCGAEAHRLGFSVASGGARGCDMAAMRKVDTTARLEILPFGLRVAEAVERRGGRCAATRITVCAPNEEFTIGSAMERNALIYAIAEFAIVANARFKSGGAWHGAIDAHRRHLTRLIVREDNGNIAHRALAALGAIPLASASNLSTALSTNSVLQKQLIS